MDHELLVAHRHNLNRYFPKNSMPSCKELDCDTTVLFISLASAQLWAIACGKSD